MGLSHKQGVRAFFSFDLAGSAAFKSAAESAFPQGTRRGPTILAPKWLSFFMKFFLEIPERVAQAVAREFDSDDRGIPRFRTEVWRITGDEVLFVTSRLQEERQLALLAKAIYSVLTEIDKELGSEGRGSQDLGLKGVLWAAGFPIRNTEFEVHPQSSRVIRRTAHRDQPDSAGLSSRGGDPQDSMGYHHREFLGPEIDLGFRLCGHACPRRLLVSLDVAELIASIFAKIPRPLRPKFHHVGWTVLRGLYGGQPYPLVWVDYGPSPAEKRKSYEAIQSPHAARYFSGEAHVQAEEILQLAEDYLEDTKDTRIKMYIEPSPPPEHAIQYEAALRERES